MKVNEEQIVETNTMKKRMTGEEKIKKRLRPKYKNSESF